MVRARRNATRPPLRWRLRPQREPLEGRVVPSTTRVTSWLNAGRGTLRAAIRRANLDSGPDPIKFARTALGTILLTGAKRYFRTPKRLEDVPATMPVGRESA